MSEPTQAGETIRAGNLYRSIRWLQDTLGALDPTLVALVPNDEMAAWNAANYPHGYNPGLRKD